MSFEDKNIKRQGKQLKIVVLASFIIVAIYLIIRLPQNKHDDTIYFSKADEAKIDSFMAQLDTTSRYKRFEYNDNEEIILPARRLFVFNPNEVDSIEMLELGFKPFMARNLINYRNHGGKILTTEKFKSIYGIDTLLIDSLHDYIQYPQIVADTTSIKKYKTKSLFAFDLNCADTTLLTKLPGIGIGRAKQIINYRRQLGGYHNVAQLHEIEGIPDSIITALSPFASACGDSIKKIFINSSSIRTLKRHPYITYHQAKAIYELRWDKAHKGRLTEKDLIEIKELTPNDLQRLKPYIDLTPYEKKR